MLAVLEEVRHLLLARGRSSEGSDGVLLKSGL